MAKEIIKIGDVIQIKIADIAMKDNSRANYSEKDMLEMMASIKQHGVIQAVGVSAAEKAGKWDLVFGYRRFIGSKKVGNEFIPCRIISLSKEDTPNKFIINAIENMQRIDVLPAEQGRIFQKLLNDGLTVDEIAVRVGVEKIRIQRCLDVFYDTPQKYHNKINNPGPGVRKTADAGKIPMSIANKLNDVTRRYGLRKGQHEKLYDYASENHMTSDQVNVLGGLLGQGLDFEKAVKGVDDMQIIVLTCAVSKKDVQRVEKARPLSVHQQLYEYLQKNKDIDVVIPSFSPKKQKAPMARVKKRA